MPRSPLRTPRQLLRRAMLLLPLSLSIAAYSCSSEQPQLRTEVPVVVPRVAPSEAVKQCDRLPPGGPPFADERTRYRWMLVAVAAGNDCRARHDALRVFELNPPN